MATKTDFTSDEWKTLMAAAPMAGLAITCASPSGPVGVMKEMFSMGMAIAELIHKGSNNPLLASMIADLKERATRAEPPAGLKDPEQAKQTALAQLKDVAALVDRKAPGDAAEFKQWIFTVAQRVAEAANEGGFFGIGGERVSEAEKQTLNQISFSLGLPRT